MFNVDCVLFLDFAFLVVSFGVFLWAFCHGALKLDPVGFEYTVFFSMDISSGYDNIFICMYDISLYV